MVWTDLHDEMLCREIIGVDVFTDTKKGTVKRSEKWAEVVENLSAVECLHFKVDKRAVRDRYNLLQSNYRRKLKHEEKASGVAVEMSEVERALECIMEKEDAAEELRQEGKLKKVTDKVSAEDIRKKAMESLGETQKRKGAESGITPKKKRRSNGSETVRYLKEKHERMLEVEERKLEMEEKKIEAENQRHEELMTTLQQQQQQQMEAFQVMMLQQQQQMQMQQTQQNEMMLKLFGMLNNK
jgi:hypothetical protein